MNYSEHDSAVSRQDINAPAPSPPPPPPPPPPQHRSLGNPPPEMSRGPAYPGQQTYHPNGHNPFTDSSAALSQMSQRSSRTSSVFGGPAGMASDPRHAAIRGYSDSVESGSSDSQQYAMDHLQRGRHSPGVAMGAYPPYSDNPYNRYSSVWDHSVEQPFNPDEIADDGDDGLGPPPSQSGRRSVLNRGSTQSLPVAGGAAAGAAGVTSEAFYGPVSAADRRAEREKSLAAEAATRKKKRIAFIILAVVIIISVIVAGTVAGILLSRGNNNNAGASKTAAQDDATLLTKSSPEIQNLLNNKNLHRVFPGIDYTPIHAQYPACLTNPPSQNNITRDVAVLSQLTNVLRLYGTDCNQTDMILQAIDTLEITDMKLWLAVWLDKNQTTNDRGMNAMWDILQRKGQKPFAGVIIGNEVLYREDMTLSQLGNIVSAVKTNFSANGYTLPIATADLGDNWTAGLADIVDVVMSNVHPFFAGVTAEAASAWTINFWQQHDVVLTAGNTTKKNIISETGWPSEGGNDCGAATCTSTTQGAVASIPNMNTFMDGFVCPALANGTDYFWFEAFDEPWKEVFNTPTDKWETRWGLMDVDRNLKPAVKIPDCGGQTVKQNW